MAKASYRVGFTGTRKGMTDAQGSSVAEILKGLIDEKAVSIREFHHGACIGADEQAAMIAGNLGYTTVAHPSTMLHTQTRFASDRTLHKLHPLDRNRVIAEISQILIATPKETEEQLRSGTWATIRYANKIGRFVTIIQPDGSYLHNG